jgi:hypothetical protein
MLEKPHWIPFTSIGDQEVGYISVAEGNMPLPFEMKRVYWVYATPEHVERGNHAHIHCKQVLVAVHGKVEVELENKYGGKQRFTLESPAIGLYVPELHWRRIHVQAGAVLLCMASHIFDEADYIRSFEEFISYTA